MLGVDDSPTSLGVIPCAIDWLFRLINDQKEQTGARFSVRVSAVEITGKQECLKDLLADTATGKTDWVYRARTIPYIQRIAVRQKIAEDGEQL